MAQSEKQKKKENMKKEVEANISVAKINSNFIRAPRSIVATVSYELRALLN